MASWRVWGAALVLVAPFYGKTFVPPRTATVAQTACHPRFTIQDLGTLGGRNSRGWSINAAGEVSGDSEIDGTSDRHVVRWTAAGPEDLGLAGYARSGGALQTINDSGQIAATLNSGSGGLNAARFTGSSPEILTGLSGISEAFGINNSGQIAGVSGNPYGAVRWTGSTAESLETSGRPSRAYSINDLGEVTGYVEVDGRPRAVRWSRGAIEFLDSLAGDTGSVGYGMNNVGQITGVNSLGGNRAVRWTGTAVEDLGVLPGMLDSRGWGINDDGWVVGESDGVGTRTRAILHDGNVLWDLEQLIVGPNPFIAIGLATDINNSRQITGAGALSSADAHAFLLTPIAPCTVVITWDSPADITYGTALGATQLDARASELGTLVYTPTAGTILPVGENQVLEATFYPSDPLFSVTHASVRINVRPPVLTSIALTKTIVAGCQQLEGSVALNGPATPGGLVVALRSSSDVVVVPATTTVAAGALKSKQFVISTIPVSESMTVALAAELAGNTITRSLTVRPIGLKALQLTPNPISSEDDSIGTVILECPAAPGAITVLTSSANPYVAQPTVFAFMIPAGLRTGSFTVRTAAVLSSTTVKINAVANGTRRSKKLTVSP